MVKQKSSLKLYKKPEQLETRHAHRALAEAEKRSKVVEESVRAREHEESKGRISAALKEAELPANVKASEPESPLSTESDELFLKRMAHSISRRKGHRLMAQLYLKMTEDELARRGWAPHDIKAAIVEMTMFKERLK
jgi:hypothetical protein